MQTSIVVSGFGGQGTLFAGLILAYAAMDSGLGVTWYPSYGPAMRGGTASATVIMGDGDIGSPVVLHPDASIALNIPSMHKYELLAKPDGWLVYNISLIPDLPQRTDIQYLAVPATQIAGEIGDSRVANTVTVGALVAATSVLPVEALVHAIDDHLPKNRRALVQVNQEAIRRGAAVATGHKPR